MLVWGAKVCFAVKSLILTFFCPANEIAVQPLYFICNRILKSDFSIILLIASERKIREREIETHESRRGGQVLFGFMLITAVRTLVNLVYCIIIMHSKPS